MGWLDYLALFLLSLSITAVFFIFIYIHDLPHTIAKERDHPHEEAIHVACWLSLFTLHAMWPIVFLWAVSHKKHPQVTPPLIPGMDGGLMHQLAHLEERLRKLEAASK
jgi:Na+/H+ antiporter NhaD/arsenite permease-like protein